MLNDYLCLQQNQRQRELLQIFSQQQQQCQDTFGVSLSEDISIVSMHTALQQAEIENRFLMQSIENENLKRQLYQMQGNTFLPSSSAQFPTVKSQTDLTHSEQSINVNNGYQPGDDLSSTSRLHAPPPPLTASKKVSFTETSSSAVSGMLSPVTTSSLTVPSLSNVGLFGQADSQSSNITNNDISSKPMKTYMHGSYCDRSQPLHSQPKTPQPPPPTPPASIGSRLNDAHLADEESGGCYQRDPPDRHSHKVRVGKVCKICFI